MTSWKLKALVQGGLSLLPRSHIWNRVFQQYVTKSLALTPSIFEGKLAQCAKHVDNHSSFARARNLSSALELGTGWYPIVPVGLALAGFRVGTIDVVALLRPAEVRAVLEMFSDYARSGALARFLPDLCPDRITKLFHTLRGGQTNWRDMLASMEVTAFVADATETGLADGSVELVASNNTLEHIPVDRLARIFQEFARVLGPGGVMSHYIDMSDHYARFDAAITRFNFLRFSERRWWWFNNRLHYQNRLRLSDYISIHEEQGFEVVRVEKIRGDPSGLEGIPLASTFRSRSLEDLQVLGAWIVSVRA